ncbi:hypothetical protein FF021_02000 [Leptospira noguchii]|nr:hypothetical protein FF021_02000 [Leptospira noguchii]
MIYEFLNIHFLSEFPHFRNRSIKLRSYFFQKNKFLIPNSRYKLVCFLKAKSSEYKILNSTRPIKGTQTSTPTDLFNRAHIISTSHCLRRTFVSYSVVHKETKKFPQINVVYLNSL